LSRLIQWVTDPADDIGLVPSGLRPPDIPDCKLFGRGLPKNLRVAKGTPASA
jgi:hypothetical protein